LAKDYDDEIDIIEKNNMWEMMELSK